MTESSQQREPGETVLQKAKEWHPANGVSGKDVPFYSQFCDNRLEKFKQENLLTMSTFLQVDFGHSAEVDICLMQNWPGPLINWMCKVKE